jgi:hypothetical protein
MKAELIYRLKDILPNGDIIEIVIWKVPNPVVPSEHYFKYSLVYIVDGLRIVGFDNERGKGDHCHLDGFETSYQFTDVEKLIEDFIVEVEKRRGQ